MTDARAASPVRQHPVGIWVSVLYVVISNNLLMALSPMFWSGYSDFMHFDDAAIGRLMSVEFFGSTAATVAGAAYLHRQGLNLRYVAYSAIMVYASCNFATALFLDHPRTLTILRLVCGLSSGTVFLTAATATTSLQNPARLIAVFYGTPYMTSFVLGPMMHSIFTRWGFGTAFELIALAAAGSYLLYPLFPRYAGRQNTAGDDGPRADGSTGLLLLLTVALLLQYVANSGIWLFFERLGVLAGHETQTTANIVGFGTGMAIVGAALAAALAKVLRPLNGILIGTAVLILSTIALHFSEKLALFAFAVLAFNMMITFLTPFYFILLVETYAPAKAVIAGNISLMLGFSLGPLLIGDTVSQGGFALSINATVALFGLSIVAVLIHKVVADLPSRRDARLRSPGTGGGAET